MYGRGQFVRRPVLAAVAGTLAIVVGCGGDLGSPPPDPTTTPATSTVFVPELSERKLAEAVAFRQRYGLRSDEPWIRIVAAEPAAQAAIEEYGVPLMPFERADLRSRRTSDDVLHQIQRYGSLFPDDYAGAYMDQRVSMGFVVSFKEDVERHRRALTNLLPENVHLDVRDVQYSQVELSSFLAQVEADHGWANELGVRYLVAGTRIGEDFVYVQYRGPEDAAPLIAAYYGNPSWLSVERVGPLPWTGPRADLVIEVVDRRGRPARDIRCDFKPLDPDADEAGEGVFGTDQRGRCVLRNLPVTRYRIELYPAMDDTLLEAFDISLQPGGTTTRVAVRRP